MIQQREIVENAYGTHRTTKKQTIVLPVADPICKRDLSYACLDSIVLTCDGKGLAWDLQQHLMLCYKSVPEKGTNVS